MQQPKAKLSPTPNKAPAVPPPSRPAGPVDILAEFHKISDIYPKKAREKGNFLIIGPHGTGKTFNMIYAPAPVLIDSFDVDGCDCIPPEYIQSGRVIVDDRYEGDSIASPKAFRAWETEFHRRKRIKMFDHVGTYVIDSWTSFSAALMFEILKARGRKPPAEKADLGNDPDIVPEQSDYNVHQKTLAHYLADITSLPCNIVIIGHLLIDRDEDTKKLFSAVLMDGKKFAQHLPSLFSEYYFATRKGIGDTAEFYYRLVPMGIEPARSRLRKKDVLNSEEPQNLQALLKKAGYRWEDKPYQPRTSKQSA